MFLGWIQFGRSVYSRVEHKGSQDFWKITSPHPQIIILFESKITSFKKCFFSPFLGEMIPIDEHIFQMRKFNHQVDKVPKSHRWWYVSLERVPTKLIRKKPPRIRKSWIVASLPTNSPPPCRWWTAMKRPRSTELLELENGEERFFRSKVEAAMGFLGVCPQGDLSTAVGVGNRD